MTEFGECIIESIVEDIPHLCSINGVFDMLEDLIGASHVDDGLGDVSSFLPVLQFGMALPGIAFWLRLFSSHDLIRICSYDYSPHFLFPHGVVVVSQLRDVAVISLEGLGGHCVGEWCFQGFGGLVRVGGRCFRGFGGLGKSGRTVFSRLRRSL